jgi:hypothetical protein
MKAQTFKNPKQKRKVILMSVKASFDVSTVEGQMKVFNAQNGASVSLKNLEDGQVIECVGAMQYEEVIDSYGQEQESTVTVLFAKDGSSYAGVSDTVAKAGSKLIDFLAATKLPDFKVQIVKQKSGKGNVFINIQLVG